MFLIYKFSYNHTIITLALRKFPQCNFSVLKFLIQQLTSVTYSLKSQSGSQWFLKEIFFSFGMEFASHSE